MSGSEPDTAEILTTGPSLGDLRPFLHHHGKFSNMVLCTCSPVGAREIVKKKKKLQFYIEPGTLTYCTFVTKMTWPRSWRQKENKN